MTKPKYFVLCLTLIIVNITCDAQQHLIDSLKKLNLPKNDTSTVNFFNKLSEEYLKTNVDSSYEYSVKALELAKKIHYNKGQFKAGQLLFIVHSRKAETANGLKVALDNFDFAKKIKNDSLILEAMEDLASIYFSASFYLKGVEICNEALPIAKNLNMYKSVGTFYNQLGEIYFRGMKDFRKGEEFYLLAKEYHKRAGNEHTQAVAFINLADVNKQLKNYEKAQLYYDSALVIEERLTNNYFISYIVGGMAEIYFNTKNLEKADSLYKVALKYAIDYNFTAFESYWYAKLGNIAKEKKQHLVALSYYNRALEKAPKTIHLSNLSVYSGMASVLQDLGRYKDALFYKDQYIALKDTLNNRQQKQKIQEMEIRYLTEVHQKQVAELEKQNALSELKLAQEWQFRKLLIIGIAVLALIISYIVYLFIRKSKLVNELSRQKKEIILQHLQIVHINQLLELKTLRAQINPHFLFNALNSIQNFICKNDQDNAILYLQKFAKLIRRVLESSMIPSLSLKEEMELLKNYVELEQLRFNFSFEYKIRYEKDLNPEEISLPYLLIQPYVENAILHGLRDIENGQLDIHFKRNENYLICIVDDNGIGRQAASKRTNRKKGKSFGMSITKQRLEKISEISGESVHIEVIDKDVNGEPAGTKVQIIIPYKEIEAIVYN